MANFLAVLKTIVGIEHTIAPVAAGIFPVEAPAIVTLDYWLQRLIGKTASQEVALPANGQGPTKLNGVMEDFRSGIDFTQQVLAIEGKRLQYDETLLQGIISDQVSVFNKAAAFKATFKIVSL